jgi:CP family cyanate transporter-like MFS transporter
MFAHADVGPGLRGAPHMMPAVTELPARATPITPAPGGPAAGTAAAGAPSALLIVGVLLVAANMRPVATSLGPLLHQISRSEHLSGAVAGLLTTIPVLCFGAIAPLGGLLSRRLGIAKTLALVLCVIVAGLLARVSGGVVLLFAGTMLAAAGVACGNVLLPVIVRRSFSDRVWRMSALYTTALVAMAALAAGATVPLAHALGQGWRGGLAIWAAPALVALLVWLPQLRREPPRPPAAPASARLRELTRSPITWHLTIFFAVQSWGFYALLAWMPSIFQSHGLSSTTAGFLLGLSGIMAVPAALSIPTLAARFRHQGGIAVTMALVTLGGYAGLLLAPAGAPELWACLIGFGQGASFPLALTMIVLRSGSAQLTSSLSTHVQGGGYLLAASGPLLIGVLHDATGSWTTPLIALMIMLVPQVLTGIGAGRDRTLSAPATMA